MSRLSPDTMAALPASVERPDYNRARLRPRLVHMGVGAFHRGHQAVYTDDANKGSGGDWGCVGVSLRSRTAQDQLEAQGGLYTVGTRDGSGERYRLVGNLLAVHTAPHDPAAVLDALCHPDVSVVTLTITEKGYALDPATGALMIDGADIAADLTSPHAPRSAIGTLVEALRRRRAAGAPPISVVSCDNLPSNGHRVASALRQYAERLDADLARHIEADIACPETMVDRIVPATTDEDRARARAALGVADHGHVVAEPFRQWVIENRFSGPRPAWDAAGARIVSDVAAFETAKLRLLNGPHSAIAYLGYLAGHDYVHEVMADPVLSRFVAALMDGEILPTVAEPPGMPLGPYAEELRERFRNPALDHKTWQIAMDGSQKLPQRLLNTVRDRRALGLGYDRLALAVAGWMRYAGGRDLAGRPVDVRDPLAQRMAAFGGGDASSTVGAFLGLRDVFGDLSDDPDFARTVTAQLEALLRLGVPGAAAALA